MSLALLELLIKVNLVCFTLFVVIIVTHDLITKHNQKRANNDPQEYLKNVPDLINPPR